MDKWFMVTVVGKDRPSIVAHLTAALFEGGCNLGEASMMRLAGNFTIMLMVQYEGTAKSLTGLIDSVTESMGLALHVDRLDSHQREHLDPDVRVTVTGADRAGIVAEVTGALAEAGLNILNLETDVAGDEARPIYLMHIEGRAEEGMAALESAVEIVQGHGVDCTISAIDTLIG